MVHYKVAALVVDGDVRGTCRGGRGGGGGGWGYGGGTDIKHRIHVERNTLPALHVPAPLESPPPPEIISEVTKGSESLMIQQKESRFLLQTTLTILYQIPSRPQDDTKREHNKNVNKTKTEENTRTAQV